MKFITDRSLGTLAKWLRILGYDTLLYEGNADRSLLTAARGEERVVLTRKKDMAQKQFSGKKMILMSDRVENQLKEVIDTFSLRPEQRHLFSRCLQCNERLIGIGKDDVKGRVPPYTFENQDAFMICPMCRRIFWPGTHKERAEKWLRSHIRTDRP
jgi:uncharacterized protein with PIN domain